MALADAHSLDDVAMEFWLNQADRIAKDIHDEA